MNQISVQTQVACLPVPPEYALVPHGLSIAEMAVHLRVGSIGTRAWVRGVRYQWEPVPDDMWQFVRPHLHTEVRFTYRPKGGGSRNQLFATIAIVALTIVAPQFGAAASSAALAAGASAATAAFVGSAVSAGVVLGGSLIANKIFAPDVQPFDNGAKRDNSKAYAEVTTDTNPFGKEAYIPLVVGSRRIAPPDLTQPYVYTKSGIQYIDRLFGLWGKHSITDIRVNNTSIADFPAITTEILDGDGDTTSYSFVDKITKTRLVNETIPAFALSEGNVLEDQTVPANSEPRWVYFSTSGHESLEEISLRLRLGGMYKTDSEGANVILPIRIQFRPKGGGSGNWVSLPEIHFTGRSTAQIDQEIRIRWDEAFGADTATGGISHRFYSTVPAVVAYTLSDGSTGVQWQCASYFDNGSGMRDVVHIESKRSGVNVRLDPNIHQPGAYEWRIIRGYSVRTSDFGTDTYLIGGVVESLFVGRLDSTTYNIEKDQGLYPSQISVTSVVSIANERPVQLPGIAQIAMRAKGQNAQGVTCRAARYVMDWDGSAWANETAVCRNPATHYRQLLYDFLSYYNIDTSLIDDDAFVAWRQECEDRGYECNAIFAGESIGEILAAIATAGFARRVFSDVFSIEYFRDRSADTPVQLFSYRNSTIDFSIAGADRQAGLRVAFDDEDADFASNEVEVQLDNAADNGSFEAISYKAITNIERIRRRAYFDLLQVDQQRRTWIVDTAIEGVACQMGDLVSVVTDLFDDNSNGTRILEVVSTTQFRIDQLLSTLSTSTWASDPAIDDIFDVGESTLIFLHTASGIEQRTITAITDDLITVDSPFSTTPVAGTIATVTSLSNTEHRCIVLRVEQLDEERARLTLVDEAPQIYEELTKKFGETTPNDFDDLLLSTMDELDPDEQVLISGSTDALELSGDMQNG